MDMEGLGGLFTRLSSVHELGIPFAKTLVIYGLGFSLGKNIIKVMRGASRWSVAIADVVRDTIIAFILGYFIGAMGIGQVITDSFDSLNRTTGGSITDPVSVISGLFYSMGVDFGAASTVALTAPAIVIGAFAGMIFGFFFN